MSVTNPTAPALFGFSKNPLVVELVSDDTTAIAGVKSVWMLQFLSAIAAGMEIPITWTARNLKMKAAVAPDNSGTEFPSGDGSFGYVTSIVAYFKANFYLNRDFEIEQAPADPYIIFTARSAGIDFNPVQVTTPNYEIIITTAGVTELQKPNFKHYLEIWLAGNNIYSRSLALDPDGLTSTKDLSEVLHASLVAASTDKPDLSATTWQACVNTLQPYHFSYAQYYGDNPVVKRVYQSGTRYVNRGGLSVQAALGQSLAGFLRPGAVNSKTLCLRQGSKMGLVQTDQPEWLYWINLTGADVNIRLRIEISFSDGSASFVYYRFAFAADANKKYCAPVGYLALDIRANTPAGKFCTSYAVRVCSAAGDYLSATYTYVIDQYREWPRYFVYLNSLGGYQTLYTWGKAQSNVDRVKQDIAKQVTYTQAAQSGRNQEVNTRLQNSVLVNTGYTTDREIAQLQDFLISEERYLVSGDRLIPIGLKTDKMLITQDGDNLHAASFEFYPLSDEWVYTDDPKQVDILITNGSGTGISKGFNVISDEGDYDNYYDDL